MATEKKLMMAASGGVSADYWRFNLDYASYNPPASLNGDVSTADPINSGSITGETTSVNDIQFNSSGNAMYLLDTNEIIEFRVIDPAWHLPDLNVGINDTITSGNDGMHLVGGKMFAVEGGAVYEYTISGGTYTLAHTLDVSAQETDAAGIFVGDDGSKMYIGGVTSNNIYEYTLSTPYLLSSATYVQALAAGAGTITSIRFRSDGLRMYAQKGVYDIHQYDLTSAWDLSTASYIQEYTPTDTAVGVKGLWFSDDMSTMAIGCDGDNKVYRYSMSGATIPNNSHGVSFKTDGTKMFISGSSGVTEYDLSTAWDTSSATLANTLAVSGLAGIYFKSDGTQMFVVDNTADSVKEYALSTPWSLAVSSVTLTHEEDISAESPNPLGISLRPNGKVMFVTHGARVDQYELTVAWDLSSAAYVKTSPGLTDANDVAFSPNGLRMFLTQDSETGLRQVNQYQLGIPWDVAAATSVRQFNISTMAGEAKGIFFNEDGDKLFVTQSKRLFSYALNQ
jgi:hypothetical protein